MTMLDTHPEGNNYIANINESHLQILMLNQPIEINLSKELKITYFIICNWGADDLYNLVSSAQGEHLVGVFSLGTKELYLLKDSPAILQTPIEGRLIIVKYQPTLESDKKLFYIDQENANFN